MNRERYDRQLILKGFGEEAQEKLAAARVLVIGAGGLGCPALQYLAAAGIGHIGIVDHDVVSLSNLHRQVLYGVVDIGKFKAETAVEKLKALNPDIQLQASTERLVRQNVLDLIASYDMVLDGTDNFESRYLINDACALFKKPVVFAAVSGYEGQIAIFHAGDDSAATNYRDIFPVEPAQNEVLNCEENGVLGVLPGIIGTMQAAEAIKLITGIGEPLINRLLNYNLLTRHVYELTISPALGTYTLPQTEAEFLTKEMEVVAADKNGLIMIGGPELDELLEKASTLLVDVREPHEFPVLNKAVFRQAPMSDLAGFMKEDIPEYHIVLICQHGIRSLAAAEALKEKYGLSKNIYNLKGGISRWQKHFTGKT